jgi:hypothetical protein
MNPDDRHSVADGQVADTRAVSADSQGSVLPRVPMGQSTVQLLGDQWFIGRPGAAHRIDDAAALDSWLAANGWTDHRDLDFAGNEALEQRFRTEMGIVSSN